jgi:hypothetical protein
MNKNIINLIDKMDLNESANEKNIAEVENRIGIKFPIHYREFMLYSNGAEGELGENSYLVIWSIEEIISLNEAYSVSQHTPGILYFGSDGGDIAYAFDVKNMSIIEIPFESIHIEDARLCAHNFNDFIESLYNE